MRVVITRVLPVPAPARTSSGPSVVVTASRCAGLSAASSAASPPRARTGVVEEGARGAKGGGRYTTRRSRIRFPSAATA